MRNDVQNTKITVKVKQLKVEQQNFINNMLDIFSVRRMLRVAQKEIYKFKFRELNRCYLHVL